MEVELSIETTVRNRGILLSENDKLRIFNNF